MKSRLRDQVDSGDPAVARAGRMLQSARSLPPPSPSALRQLRARLAEARLEARGRQPRRITLRMALAALPILIIAGVASAKVASQLIATWTAPPPAEVVVPAPPRQESARPSPSVPPLRVIPPVPPSPREPTPDPRERGDGAGLLISARRALDDKPEQADGLVEAYLGRHPKGAALEEALFLSFEVAVKRSDEKLAAARADHYFERFPLGRYGRAIREALRLLRLPSTRR